MARLFKLNPPMPGAVRHPAGRRALKLVVLAVLAGCGGGQPPEPAAMVEEDRIDVFGDAPVDHGAGAGVPQGEARAGAQAVVAPAGTVPGGPADAHLKGVFGPAFSWPIIPVHTVLLADGRVLSYGSKPNGLQGGQLHYAVWDPALGTGGDAHLLLPNSTGTDIFCAGQVLLPVTGDVLLVGGDRIVNGKRNYANNDVNLFTPADNALTRQSQSMAYQRWYATLVTAPTGEVAVLGGRIDRYYEGDAVYPPTDDTYASTPEVYSPTAGWRTLSTATSDAAYGGRVQAWNYPRAWWSPKGKVVTLNVMGEIHALDIAGTGSVAKLPGTLPRGAYNLPAAMYQPGRILSVRNGGQAVVVDINGDTPTVTTAAPLSGDRQFGNATVLADGTVWANGGSSTGNDLVGAYYHTELWNPATGSWTTTATATKPRLYHSVSMLMPDGSVLTGGGGAPGPVANMNAEIWYPPYLYAKDGSGLPAARPVITSAPASATWGQTIPLTLSSKQVVTKLALIRFGAVTHAFSNEQRFESLSFTQSGTSLSVKLPATADTAPPGYYMLFALNKSGTPSVAKVIRIGS